jgi:60 kDa SS-A/Ro ribonucleoprotein
MNKQTFRATRGKQGPTADTRNEAGGLAYSRSPKGALAQLAVTNTFEHTFYANADQNLDKAIEACNQLSRSPSFVAKTAVYARQHGFMKDMPAFLCAWLASKEHLDQLDKAFPHAIDNALQVKKFMQVIRSGVLGRKSFGSHVRNLIRSWLENRTDEQVFRDAVGGDITMADLIRLVHPKPANTKRSALYAYLIDRKYNKRYLPQVVKNFEAFKEGKTDEVPDVDFRYLTSQDLDKDAWVKIAKSAKWHMLRMNLNTFARHGLFSGSKGEKLAEELAEKLSDRDMIRKSRVFPYQLMMAYNAVSTDVPPVLREALQDAMEVATENATTFEGKIAVCPDVSGSMKSAITGNRGTATSEVRCIDVAALISAVYLRNNKLARVLPFDTRIYSTSELNPRDSVMSNAQKLARYGGGGTECALTVRHLNQHKIDVDLVVIVSDSESWKESINVPVGYTFNRGTPLMGEWNEYKAKHATAKLVLLDIQPYTTAQAPTKRDDILLVGGWSDTVFDVIDLFARGDLEGEGLVKKIEDIDL